MIGRLDPQKGFDLLPRPRRRCSSAGCGWSSRAAATRTLADPFRAIAAARPGPRRLHRALRPRDGPQDLCRRRLLRDALALRAMRPGPDDRPALRDATDRPPRGGLADTVIDETARTRRRDGVQLRGRDGRRVCSRHATRRSACGRAAGPRGRACSIEGWRSTSTGSTGSAPRYLDAYRRAIDSGAAASQARWAGQVGQVGRPGSAGAPGQSGAARRTRR